MYSLSSCDIPNTPSKHNKSFVFFQQKETLIYKINSLLILQINKPSMNKTQNWESSQAVRFQRPLYNHHESVPLLCNQKTLRRIITEEMAAQSATTEPSHSCILCAVNWVKGCTYPLCSTFKTCMIIHAFSFTTYIQDINALDELGSHTLMILGSRTAWVPG